MQGVHPAAFSNRARSVPSVLASFSPTTSKQFIWRTSLSTPEDAVQRRRVAYLQDVDPQLLGNPLNRRSFPDPACTFQQDRKMKVVAGGRGQ